MPKMEQCAISVCFLIKLDKVLAQYLSTKMLTDLIIKAFIVTILECALHASYGYSLLRKDVFPSLREGSFQIKMGFFI